MINYGSLFTEASGLNAITLTNAIIILQGPGGPPGPSGDPGPQGLVVSLPFL